MRVTIDATVALMRSSGVKSYAYHWVRHLRRLAQGDKIDAFPYLEDFGRLDHAASSMGRWPTYWRLALLHFVNAPGNAALDWILAGSDIFHTSNQVQRVPRRAKLTATLHDLTCWLMPEFHRPRTIVSDRKLAGNILRRAGGVIAVSENTRQDAIRILNIAPDRIQTIYSGIPQEYFGAQPTRRQRPYALYVGTIEPRKNLDTLLDAWRQLRPELRQEFDLVIAGPFGWNAESTLARIQTEATYLGYVPEADLPGLVAGATVFVYPSLYEGFGFPVAQAMAAGVAVLTSNNSCLPEITAGGALLEDPRSADGLAHGLTQLLESESLRDEISAKGRRRAERFRWESCAAESLEFFRRIAGS